MRAIHNRSNKQWERNKNLGDSRLLLITGKGANQVVNQQRQLQGVRSIVTHPQPTHKGYILVFTQGWQGRLGSHICKAECLQCRNLLWPYLLCRIAASMLEVSLILAGQSAKTISVKRHEQKCKAIKTLDWAPSKPRLQIALRLGPCLTLHSTAVPPPPHPPTRTHARVHATDAELTLT